MAAPPTRPPADMWKCHMCNITYLKATTLICFTPSCENHTQCSLCTNVARNRSAIPEDRAIDSISKPVEQCALPSSGEDSLSTIEPDIREQDLIHISIVIDDDTLEPPQHYDGTVPMHDLPQLPMVGWWRCCRCKNDNNPELTEGICTVCGHTRDSSCIALG
jgi:hypothetical protein